jgi:hypothetical protein
MDPLLIGALAGSGLGLLRTMEQKPEADYQRKVAEATARYSPWTGLAPQQVVEPDMMGNIMQGGVAGAQLGQGIETNKAYTDYLAQIAAQNAINNSKTVYTGDKIMPPTGTMVS